jgi:hypothetical protein
LQCFLSVLPRIYEQFSTTTFCPFMSTLRALRATNFSRPKMFLLNCHLATLITVSLP